MIKNLPNNDNWKLMDKDNDSQYYEKSFNFDFSSIHSNDIKKIVKLYVWRNYIEENKTLSKLYYDVKRFKYFNTFVISRRIFNLKDLTNNDIDMFMVYLNTLVSEKTNKPLAYSFRKLCLDVVKAIIRWGQIYMPQDFPREEIFTGREYTGVNKKIKTDFIPDQVIKRINKALLLEDNLYIRCSIVILKATGMRSGDLLNLKVGCMKPHLISGHTMTWFNHKSRRWMQDIPINSECAVAINELIIHTVELRRDAPENINEYIFIHKISAGKAKGEVRQINSQALSAWLNGEFKNNKMIRKGFIQRHNITDESGSFYNINSRLFRRTLATDMFSKGVDLVVIKEMLGHSNPQVTKRHYADVKDKERSKVWQEIGIIGNINDIDKSIIPNEEELLWFEENKGESARMCDGYCTKPIVNGEICDRLKKRKKCYTCVRYITTPEYLEAHRMHLRDLENQLEDNIYGDHFAEHIAPTIEILKEIINRLERL
ncbi:phage integrase family protein [Alkaliphilus metalliredigens QYMF]|uniref:Phage integrase family protein n=1 Tax=Alkaliphilus metalliredigens (strain QYMF) TaxID=293826 RepID=A6TNK5_ALKMQ|nr:tyrosine-type recombinase/integrase [Alkaliphilus metalliredigens]ABR47773.1 phage integrase family protein [Alkaliphilus metalliredigens QYMF]